MMLLTCLLAGLCAVLLAFFTWFSVSQEAQIHTTLAFLSGFRSLKRHTSIPYCCLCGFRSLKKHKSIPHWFFYVVFGPSRGTNPYHTGFLTWFSVPQEAQIHTTLVFVYVVFGPSRGTNSYHTGFFTWFSVPQEAQIHTTLDSREICGYRFLQTWFYYGFLHFWAARCDFGLGSPFLPFSTNKEHSPPP